MNVRDYLDTVVRPNVAAFEASYADLRLAHNAAHSVDALAAHIFVAAGGSAAKLGRDDTEYRENLAAKDEMFRLLRDVAKAAKHVELTRGKPEVSKADQISTKQLGYGEARYGEGRYGSPPQAVVTTDSGDHRVLEAVVVRALAFLEHEMKVLGI